MSYRRDPVRKGEPEEAAKSMLVWIETFEHARHSRCRRRRDRDRTREHATAIRKRAEEAIRCQIRLRKGPIRSQAVDDQEENGWPAGSWHVSVGGLHIPSI